MLSPIALVMVHNLVSTGAALLPLVGGMFAGLAVVLFRSPVSTFRPFGPRESESLMNFSSLGTLRCVCGAERSMNAAPDRRQFCRSCGCEVVAPNPAMLEKQLSRQEITAMTGSLRDAAIRASHLELPPSITTIQELHQFLDGAEPKRSYRPPPGQGSPVEQTQVH